MMKLSGSLVCFSLAALSVACGGSDKPTGQSQAAVNECGLHTKYDGDEYCILPPAPGEGIQLHAGPTNYDDPVEVEPYLINPGDENVTDFAAAVPESGFYYLRQKNRMRPSSHHMIIFTLNSSSIQPGLVAGGCPMTSATGFIPGSQTPSRDFPGEMAPEDQGMASRLNDSNLACFQMHYINTSGDHPVLREGWINLYKEPDASVTQYLHPIFMVGDFLANHPPLQVSYQNEKLALNLTTDTRVYGITAHVHAHTVQYKVWRQHAGQAAPGDLVYETFNWHDPIQAGFNSVIKNPMMDEASKTDGAISGQFFVQPGDTFNWECKVDNTLSTSLNFGNLAEKAEMCMLTGSYISPTAGLMSGTCMGGNCSANLPL